MIANESIMHHYAMLTVKLGFFLAVVGVVVGYLWFKWIRNR